MHLSPTSAPVAFLLQTAEATKITADAAAKVGQHAADTPFTALLWLGLIIASVIAAWQYVDNRKIRKDKDEAVAAARLEASTAITAKFTLEAQLEATKARAIKEALQEARTQWQQEMAIDLAHEQDLFKQARQQYEAEITRLRDDNKEKDRQILEGNNELRKQIANDAKLFEAMNNNQRLTVRTLHAHTANQQEIMRVLGFGFPEAKIRDPYTIDVLS